MRRYLLAALSLSPALSFAAEAAPEKRPPNVILILADDLGYGDVSCNGQGKIKTPSIDKLAAEGLRFTDGYAPSSTCTPTRYSIMTGEYAWRKKGTGILAGDAPLIISPSRTTLPRIFKNAGYTTAAFGKWHLGLGNGKPDFNKRITPGLNELGFDYAFNMAATGDRVPCVYMKNGLVENLDPNDPITIDYSKNVGDSLTLAELRRRQKSRAPDAPKPDDEPDMKFDSNYGHADTIVNGIGRIGFMTGGTAALWDDRTLSDTFNAQALKFIRENKTKPFFVYYAAHEPHVPRDPNPRFVGKSGLGARGDAVVQFDDEVAKIMATLKEEGLDDNTLVILSSDNGPAVADGYADGALKTETKAGHHANGVYRAGKYTEFEGGHRMPFIARWPGHIKPGATSAEPVSLIDLPATAAAITGGKLTPTDAPDSLDLLPVLTEGAKSPHPALIYGNAQAAGIRAGKWKLLVAQQPKSDPRNPRHDGDHPTGVPLLFDLEADPKESVNLAEKHPDIVKRLTADLDTAVKAGFTRPGATKVDIR